MIGNAPLTTPITTVIKSGRERRLRVIGTESDTRDLWRWLGRSVFADTRDAARL